MDFDMEVIEVVYRKHECFITLGTAKVNGLRDRFEFRLYSTDRAFKRYKPGDRYLLKLEKREE